jgi:biotin carboxyl carrier protein
MIPRIALAAIAAAVLITAPAFPAHAQTEAVVSVVISGQVLPLQLATVGQVVTRGTPLMFVRTTTGAATPAAVTTMDGRVTRVFVRVGQYVNIGDPVVAIALNSTEP